MDVNLFVSVANVIYIGIIYIAFQLHNGQLHAKSEKSGRLWYEFR